MPLRTPSSPPPHTLPSPPFPAVQRGDAEYSQKLWRVVRGCVELGDKNPIVQIHDQGAGGNCNVVKEIIYPLGGKIDVRAVKVRGSTGVGRGGKGGEGRAGSMGGEGPIPRGGEVWGRCLME